MSISCISCISGVSLYVERARFIAGSIVNEVEINVGVYIPRDLRNSWNVFEDGGSCAKVRFRPTLSKRISHVTLCEHVLGRGRQGVQERGGV